MDETFGPVPVRLKRAGSERTVIYDLENKTAVVVSNRQASTLLGCVGFKTIAGHREYLQATWSSEESISVENSLESLRSAGLLLKKSELLQQATKGSKERRPHLIENIALMTSDRPACLLRLVRTIIDYQHRSGRELHIQVFDDSSDPKNSDMNEEIVRREFIASRRPVQVIDRKRRQARLDRLRRRTGLPPSVANAMFGVPNGFRRSEAANRNCALLCHSGLRFIAVDDDILFQGVAENAQYMPALFASRQSHNRTRFISESASAVEQATSEVDDVLYLHDNYLGSSTSLDALEVNHEMTALCTSPLWRIMVKGIGTIRLTQPGIHGDPGTSMEHWRLNDAVAQHGAPLWSDEEYETARTCRTVFRSPRSVVITDSTECMSYFLGIDCVEFLPPFLPFGRNADGVFGELLRLTCPYTFTAYLPYAVRHERPSSIPISGTALWMDAARIKESELFLDLLKSGRSRLIGVDGHQERISRLAMHLSDLASLSAGALKDLLAETIRQMLVSRAIHYTELLDKHQNMPAAWKADVGLALERTLLVCAEPFHKIANGTEDEGLSPRRVASFREFLSMSASILQVWPQILAEEIF